MSDIPSDLFVEILRRVDVESLFCFRSVCKSWRRIIDDPSFSKKHIHRGIGKNWFFRKHNMGKLFLSPINELIYSNECNSRIQWANATHVKILVGRGVPRMPRFPVPSCNGLILLSSCNTDLVWRIWNPFTGESLELGKCDEFAEGVNFVRIYSGIGYDEANDDYKVVRIVGGVDTYIYSVNSKEWSKIMDFPACLTGDADGVFAFGALHWVVKSSHQDVGERWIAALDLDSRIYRKIAMPSEIAQQTLFFLRLYELSGCLFLCCAGLIGHSVVWMMKVYGNEDTWVKIISLKILKLIKPLAYVKSKDQVLLYDMCEGKYWWYNVGKNCAQRLFIEGNENGFKDESHVYGNLYDTFSSQVFPASLIRLKRSDDYDENVILQGPSKRKRKRAIAIERLPMKITHGASEDWPI